MRAVSRGDASRSGAPDSAQAAIMPGATTCVRQGLAEGEDLLVRIDSDVGKHGDTGTSERDA